MQINVNLAGQWEVEDAKRVVAEDVDVVTGILAKISQSFPNLDFDSTTSANRTEINIESKSGELRSGIAIPIYCSGRNLLLATVEIVPAVLGWKFTILFESFLTALPQGGLARSMDELCERICQLLGEALASTGETLSFWSWSPTPERV